jgi:hypothetical protein
VTIHDFREKFKHVLNTLDVQVSALIVIVGIGSFLLGKASESGVGTINTINKLESQVIAPDHRSNPPASVSGYSEVSTSTAATIPQQGDALYVASKSGTKYHLPWCSGALRIKEENKIFFTSKNEAEKAGYEPAANCKGI